MKHLKKINEAVGSINERRASAESLLKAVVKGDSSEVEGIKLSKEMADAFLDWLRGSTYGKKFGALPFYKLFTAAFNWGLSRYTTSKELKKEYKELNVKAKEMSKAEMNKESVVTEAKIKVTKKDIKDIEEGVKGYDIGPKLDDFDGMDFYNAQYEISDDDGFTDAVDEDGWKSIFKIAKKYKSKLKKHGIKSEKDLENFAKWLSGGEHMKSESVVNEAKFVKSYDTKVNDAETKKDVSKIYPKAEFFVGKHSHFFGELEPNLFFKAYYAKYYKEDTGKSIKGDFKITSVYSKKGSKYVELLKESEVNEAAPKMKQNKDAEYLQELMNQVANAQKGGMASRYGKDFDKAKTKALRAIKDMVMYSKIGI